MFSMHDFIMQALLDAVGKMADYQVILNAAGWQQRGVLTEEDLAILQTAIDEKNKPEPEPILETSVEAPTAVQ